MTKERKENAAVVAFLVALLAAGAYTFYSINASNDDQDRALQAENCRSAHANRRLERKYIVRDYRKFKRRDYAQFFNDPDNRLVRELVHDTRIKLKVRESNRRVPDYCKAHDVPEDQRFWPKELRDKRRQKRGV